MLTELEALPLTVGDAINPLVSVPLTEVYEAILYEVPFCMDGELTSTTPLKLVGTFTAKRRVEPCESTKYPLLDEHRVLLEE